MEKDLSPRQKSKIFASPLKVGAEITHQMAAMQNRLCEDPSASLRFAQDDN